jgi:hypothetical protein
MLMEFFRILQMGLLSRCLFQWLCCWHIKNCIFCILILYLVLCWKCVSDGRLSNVIFRVFNHVCHQGWFDFFLFLSLLFLFLALFIWLGNQTLHWIRMKILKTLILQNALLILQKMFQLFPIQYTVGYGSVIYSLY